MAPAPALPSTRLVAPWGDPVHPHSVRTAYIMANKLLPSQFAMGLPEARGTNYPDVSQLRRLVAKEEAYGKQAKVARGSGMRPRTTLDVKLSRRAKALSRDVSVLKQAQREAARPEERAEIDQRLATAQKQLRAAWRKRTAALESLENQRGVAEPNHSKKSRRDEAARLQPSINRGLALP